MFRNGQGDSELGWELWASIGLGNGCVKGGGNNWELCSDWEACWELCSVTGLGDELCFEIGLYIHARWTGEDLLFHSCLQSRGLP